MNTEIRVIIADNHRLILAGLRSLMAEEKDITVIATATDGERLLDAVKRFHPDVVIADVQMPYIDGITCIGHIRHINLATRILLLTAEPDPQTMQAALTGGTDGLLLKTDPPEQLIQAVRQVMAGQLVYTAVARRWLQSNRPQPGTATSASLSAGVETLSEREREVLQLVAHGHTNSQVAQQLHISQNTVKHHLKNIYKHLSVTNRTEASRWFHQQRV